jgi:hypothetical protein
MFFLLQKVKIKAAFNYSTVHFFIYNDRIFFLSSCILAHFRISLLPFLNIGRVVTMFEMNKKLNNYVNSSDKIREFWFHLV